MSRCKWDRDKGTYLVDGEECKYDEHGDRTYHCKAKRSCSHHIGKGEQTCGRCVGDTRNDVKNIDDLAPLVLVEALSDGVNSEAAWLAAPAADPRGWSERRVASIGHLDHWLATGRIKEGQYVHARNLIDDDEHHPYNVLTRWHMMLAEDYGHRLPDLMTVADSAAYLLSHLHTIAQDDGQDFRLLKSEMRACRQHLEAVLHNAPAGEKGASCPECVGAGNVNPKHVKLRREYAYWKYEGEEKGWRLRYRTTPAIDDEAEAQDRWVCPRNRAHVWAEEVYRKWIEERKALGA